MRCELILKTLCLLVSKSTALRIPDDSTAASLSADQENSLHRPDTHLEREEHHKKHLPSNEPVKSESNILDDILAGYSHSSAGSSLPGSRDRPGDSHLPDPRGHESRPASHSTFGKGSNEPYGHLSGLRLQKNEPDSHVSTGSTSFDQHGHESRSDDHSSFRSSLTESGSPLSDGHLSGSEGHPSAGSSLSEDDGQLSGSRILDRMKPRPKDDSPTTDSEYQRGRPIQKEDDQYKETSPEPMRAVEEFRVSNGDNPDSRILVESMRAMQERKDEINGFRIHGDNDGYNTFRVEPLRTTHEDAGKSTERRLSDDNDRNRHDSGEEHALTWKEYQTKTEDHRQDHPPPEHHNQADPLQKRKRPIIPKHSAQAPEPVHSDHSAPAPKEHSDHFTQPPDTRHSDHYGHMPETWHSSQSAEPRHSSHSAETRHSGHSAETRHSSQSAETRHSSHSTEAGHSSHSAETRHPSHSAEARQSSHYAQPPDTDPSAQEMRHNDHKKLDDFVDLNWVLSQYNTEGKGNKEPAYPHSIEQMTDSNHHPRQIPSNRSRDEEVNEKTVDEVLAGTVQSLKMKGLHLGEIEGGKCGPNEVYLLDKDKMILVSSGNIAHDLTDLTKFEENLLNQIKNQESIINTLKLRLKSFEDQKNNVHNIIKAFKANEESHKIELSMTKDLLNMANKRNYECDNARNELEKRTRHAEQKLENMDLLIRFKNKKMKTLLQELENGKVKQELSRLREKVYVLKKQADMEKKAKEELEDSLNKIVKEPPVDVVDVKTEYGKKKEVVKKECTEVVLLQDQIRAQDTRINLLEGQISEQTKTTELLNGIILKKDEMVMRLQNQVSEYLNHDISYIKGCMSKESLIHAQYEALVDLKALTLFQDKYRKAKDTALKILQNTVYEMVERIPSCRDKAVEGLKKEIDVMTFNNQPFDDTVSKLQVSLKNVVKLDDNGKKVELVANMDKVISRQKTALDLCNMEVESKKITKEALLSLQSQRDKRSILIAQKLDIPVEVGPLFPPTYRVQQESRPSPPTADVPTGIPPPPSANDNTTEVSTSVQDATALTPDAGQTLEPEKTDQPGPQMPSKIPVAASPDIQMVANNDSLINSTELPSVLETAGSSESSTRPNTEVAIENATEEVHIMDNNKLTPPAEITESKSNETTVNSDKRVEDTNNGALENAPLAALEVSAAELNPPLSEGSEAVAEDHTAIDATQP